MSQRHPQLDTFYRFALGGYVFVLVLAMYAGTSDPTIHVKDLLTSWTAALLAGSYAVMCWVLRKPLKRPVVFQEVALCLLAFLMLGTLFSDFFRYSLLETGLFFSLFALYWLASQVYATPAQVLKLFTAFCSAVFLAGLYAVVQKAGLDPFPWGDTTSDTYTNLPATFGNPNYAAHAIILALIMIVCLVRAGAAWAGWVFLPVLFFHLYSTGQRAGWIALAGAALLVGLAFVVLRHSRRPVLGTAATLLVFVAIGAGAVAGTMYWTHARTGNFFPLDLSLLLRYQSYVSATNMLFDSPIAGRGPAVYGLAYPPYWTPYEQEWFAQEGLMNEHVHNDLLELAIDGGLAAAGSYLLLLILGICHGLLLVARGGSAAYRRIGYTFAALFCAFGIDGLFGFNLRVPVTAALFFLMMGMLDGIWSAGQPPAPPKSKNAIRLGGAFRAAFVLLLLACTWQESRRFTSEYYFYRGMRAQNRAQFNDAEAAYEKAAHYARWNWNISRRMGLLELERQRPDLAIAAFETALEKNPAYFLTHLPMARADLMLAQAAVAGEHKDPAMATTFLDMARTHAGAVVQYCPAHPSANDLLARIESIAAIVNRDDAADPDPAIQTAHWQKARQYLKMAIDHGAENAGELYRMLVQVESSLGNIDAAEQALRSALRVAPDEERTWPLFLTFARQNKRYPQLRDTLFRQIDRLHETAPAGEAENDRMATAYRWLAVVLEEGFGDVDGALDALNSGTQFGPRHAQLWSHFAAFTRKYDKMPALESAIQTSCAALEARNESPLPQVAAVNSILNGPANGLDQASRLLLAGLRAYPPNAALSPQITFGWAAQILQENYGRLLADDNAPCESALNLGVVSATLNQLDPANTLFERAMGCLTDGRRAFAAVHWADSLSRMKEDGKALALLRETEKSYPGNVDLRWAIARTLARQNNMEEARTAYQALLQDGDLTPQGKEQIQKELALLGPSP